VEEVLMEDKVLESYFLDLKSDIKILNNNVTTLDKRVDHLETEFDKRIDKIEKNG
jgi:hypothetical protein